MASATRPTPGDVLQAVADPGPGIEEVAVSETVQGEVRRERCARATSRDCGDCRDDDVRDGSDGSDAINGLPRRTGFSRPIDRVASTVVVLTSPHVAQRAVVEPPANRCALDRAMRRRSPNRLEDSELSSGSLPYPVNCAIAEPDGGSRGAAVGLARAIRGRVLRRPIEAGVVRSSAAIGKSRRPTIEHLRNRSRTCVAGHGMVQRRIQRAAGAGALRQSALTDVVAGGEWPWPHFSCSVGRCG